jgi:hypothetical protein
MVRYEITAKRNVQLLNSGKKILMSGESCIVDKETDEMKKAMRIGLIDYKEYVEPKEGDKPSVPSVEASKPDATDMKLRMAAKNLGIKDYLKLSAAELKKLVDQKRNGTPKVESPKLG